MNNEDWFKLSLGDVVRVSDQQEVCRALLSTCGYYNEGFTPPPGSDVIFKVGDASFFASKAVLFARSSYFAAMFNSEMKEAVSLKVQIKEVEAAVFWAVLQFICSGSLQGLHIDARTAARVFIYSDLIGLNSLKEVIIGIFSKIATSFLEEANPKKALKLVDLLTQENVPLKDISPCLLPFAFQYVPVLMREDPSLINTMHVTTLRLMLESNELAMPECDVLRMVVSWCKASYLENTEGMPPSPKKRKTTSNELECRIPGFHQFFDCLRWENMDSGEVYDIIDGDNMFSPEHTMQIIRQIRGSMHATNFTLFNTPYEAKRPARLQVSVPFLQAMLQNVPYVELVLTSLYAHILYRVEFNCKIPCELRAFKIEAVGLELCVGLQHDTTECMEIYLSMRGAKRIVAVETTICLVGLLARDSVRNSSSKIIGAGAQSSILNSMSANKQKTWIHNKSNFILEVKVKVVVS